MSDPRITGLETRINHCLQEISALTQQNAELVKRIVALESNPIEPKTPEKVIVASVPKLETPVQKAVPTAPEELPKVKL